MSRLLQATGAGWPRRAVVAAVLAAITGPTLAMSLAEAFQAARVNEAQYQASGHDVEAARQSVRVARASLLPQVTLNYSHSNVAGTREFANSLNQEVKTRVEYGAPAASLSLRTPLFNAEAWNRLDQVKSQSLGAEANHRARGLDLVDRLAATYLQALLARNTLTLAENERTALEEQVRRTAQRLRRGEGTRTEEAQALASLELARYAELDARDQLTLAASRLRRLTGQPVRWVQDTPEDFALPLPQPRDAQAWLSVALENSPLVQARRLAVEAARANVRRNQAGHLPRLDLVASLTHNRNESLSNLNQTNNLNSVGVQLSVPLFSGFGTDAGVRQAVAELSRYEEELRNERENVQVEVHRLYRLLDTGVQRIDALRRAVAAGEIAVTGATRAYEAGMGTQVEVLDARSRLLSARRDLAQARNDHLGAYVRLLAVAGEAQQRPVDELERLLSVRADLPPFTQPTVAP